MKPKLVRLKDSDPLAMKLKKGAVIKMSDGWRGKVDQDDGATVTLIRDGAEPLNDQFIGYRGFTRYRTTIGGQGDVPQRHCRSRPKKRGEVRRGGRRSRASRIRMGKRPGELAPRPRTAKT
jgi:hypothetical protein